jgi:DNA polymerase-3 subunit delta'
MTFKDITNNELLINRISRSILSGNISHAYIFEGDACTDKRMLADSFVKAVICGSHPGVGCGNCITCIKIANGNHEDIVYVEKDGASVKDEAIEELQGRLKKKPYSGERNIAVIEDADTMTARAQNRLLKTLEEPFPGTVIILLANNSESLAKTILSRCVIIRWNPFVTEDFGELLKEAEILSKMLINGDTFYLNKMKLMNLSENRDDAYKLLDCMQMLYGKYIREHSYSKAAINLAIKSIEEARQDLMRGMNANYTLKSMILKIGG